MIVTCAWDRKLGKYIKGNRSDQPTNPVTAMLRDQCRVWGPPGRGRRRPGGGGAVSSDRLLKIRWEEQELGAPRRVGLSPVPLLYSHPKDLQLGNSQVTCEV